MMPASLSVWCLPADLAALTSAAESIQSNRQTVLALGQHACLYIGMAASVVPASRPSWTCISCMVHNGSMLIVLAPGQHASLCVCQPAIVMATNRTQHACWGVFGLPVISALT